MKRTAFLIWLIAACVIALPAKGLASYLVKLKNGSQYVTSEYWEEGNQIKFKISGGEIGFSKDSVLRITETDLPVEAEIITPESPSSAEAETDLKSENTPELIGPSEPGPEGAVPAESEKIGQDSLDAEVTKAYMNKKVTMVKHLEKQMAALKREIDKKKDAFWIERRKERIRTARTNIEVLGREVAGKNSGILPDWWNGIPVPAEEIEKL